MYGSGCVHPWNNHMSDQEAKINSKFYFSKGLPALASMLTCIGNLGKSQEGDFFFFSFYIFFPEASVSDIPGKRLLDKMNLWSYPVWVFCILWGQKFMSRLKGLQPNSSFQRVLRYTFESEYDTGCESQGIGRPGQELIITSVDWHV